jgi:hypothetical protein
MPLSALEVRDMLCAMGFADWLGLVSLSAQKAQEGSGVLERDYTRGHGVADRQPTCIPRFDRPLKHPGMKICSRCGRLRGVRLFDGHGTICKECQGGKCGKKGGDGRKPTLAETDA